MNMNTHTSNQHNLLTKQNREAEWQKCLKVCELWKRSRFVCAGGHEAVPVSAGHSVDSRGSLFSFGTPAPPPWRCSLPCH